MNVPSIKNKQGFTIIEVVLVLAIAALIFLMIFIALPALQRNQRDTATKSEQGNVLSALTTFQSNNKGSFPTSSSADAVKFAQYVDGTTAAMSMWPVSAANGEYEIIAPQVLTATGATSTATFASALATNPFQTMRIYTDAKCTANNTVGYKKRSAAVIVNLENGASSTDGAPVCQNT